MDATTRERIIGNCRPGWRGSFRNRLAHLRVFDREPPEAVVDLLDASMVEAEHAAQSLLRRMEAGSWSIEAGPRTNDAPADAGSLAAPAAPLSADPRLAIHLQVQGRVYVLQCRLTPSLQLRRIDA